MTLSATRRTILLTMAVFALHPLSFGAWLALIPEVKAILNLNKAELALALLGMPVAVIPTLQLASRIIPRVGPRRLLMVGFAAQPGVAILPFIADGQRGLFVALLAVGFVMAFMQVALNVYAGRLEKQLGVTIMSRCHGLWALGLMTGSFCVTFFVANGLITAELMIAVPSAVAGIIVARAMTPLRGANDGGLPPPRRKLHQMPAALFAISIFALAVAMTEGAMSDWAAIYMAERLPPGATTAGLAVTAYAACLAAGRLLGDAAKRWLGAVGLARVTLCLAILGLLILQLPLPIGFAYAAFGLIGLGVSVGFPLGVSAAAALDDVHEGANIAIMSSVAICGFLFGPPLIGFLAEAFTLGVGLLALLPGLIAGLWLCGALAPAESTDSTK
ncbi:sugar MFS transporter [Yoonia sp. R2331]|uniref:MFS transporter n=1 Tax=Yoonia sp. R2331 TaxID=3237238 RepID=UPI0034E3C1F0